MKRLVITLLVLLSAVLLARYAMEDRNYVVIGVGPWLVQTSLTVFVVLSLAVFVPVYLVVGLIRGIWSSRRRLQEWSTQRRHRRAYKRMEHGLRALGEGRWQDAETQLRKSIESGAGVSAYLGAAEAAHRLGERVRRDHYLREAHDKEDNSAIIVALARARVQIDEGDLAAAMATLQSLREQVPWHTHTLEILAKVLEQLEDWQALLELIPQLKERKIANGDELERIEQRAYAGRMSQLAGNDGFEELQGIWRRLPKSKRAKPSLLAVYTAAVLKHGQSAELEPVIRGVLDRHWNDALVGFYGQVEGSDASAQLSHAERWLNKDHEQDAGLLLCLGRLCVRNRLWGKARSYLEASISIQPRAETFSALSDLLDALGEGDAATSVARSGLAVALGRQAAPLPDRKEPEKEQSWVPG